MKVLSVRPPWAWLLVHGYKGIENRSWRPRLEPGEELAIHASLKPDREGARWVEDEMGVELPPEALEGGAILGVVRFVRCVEDSDDPWFFGPVGWCVTDPQPLPSPVPARGRLGLWTFDLSLSPEPYCGLGENVERQHHQTSLGAPILED